MLDLLSLVKFSQGKGLQAALEAAPELALLYTFGKYIGVLDCINLFAT